MKKILIVGIMALILVGMTGITSADVDIDMDVVAGEVWVKEISTPKGFTEFYGNGAFEGNLKAIGRTHGNGDYHDSYITAEAKEDAWAHFEFQHDHKAKYGEFQFTGSSYVTGKNAFMNNQFDASTLSNSFGRRDTGKDFLSAEGYDDANPSTWDYSMGYTGVVKTTSDDTVRAKAQASLMGDGSGRIDTTHWHSTVHFGRGSSSYSHKANLRTSGWHSYHKPEMDVSATDVGTLELSGYGEDSFSFSSDISMPGGGSVGSGAFGATFNFNDGMSGTYMIAGGCDN